MDENQTPKKKSVADELVKKGIKAMFGDTANKIGAISVFGIAIFFASMVVFTALTHNLIAALIPTALVMALFIDTLTSRKAYNYIITRYPQLDVISKYRRLKSRIMRAIPRGFDDGDNNPGNNRT